MFETLKNKLSKDDIRLEASMILSEMSDGGAIEDDILDDFVIPEEDEGKIEKLLAQIPDDPIGNTEEITDADLEQASIDIADPTIDELLDSEDF